MLQKPFLVLSVVVCGLVVACGERSNPASPSTSIADPAVLGPGGSTLKINAPPLVSPLNSFQFDPDVPIVLVVGNVQGKYTTFPVTYEVEVRNAAGAVVANPKFAAQAGATSSVTVTTALPAESGFSWRARATYNGAFGPWSTDGAFRTAPEAFINFATSSIFDPLTNEKSVGVVRGGRFIRGEGWQALNLTDGIDYDVDTCTHCRLEFDILGFRTGLDYEGLFDPKILTMGDAGSFGSFIDFRNNEWKMHLSIRSDNDGTGLDIVWRNGGDGEDNPGDHRIKVEPGPRWSETQAKHLVFEWTPAGFKVLVDGEEWLDDGFDGFAYAPPVHRISLGCYPRAETLQFAIYRNVKLKRI